MNSLSKLRDTILTLSSPNTKSSTAATSIPKASANWRANKNFLTYHLIKRPHSLLAGFSTLFFYPDPMEFKIFVLEIRKPIQHRISISGNCIFHFHLNTVIVNWVQAKISFCRRTYYYKVLWKAICINNSLNLCIGNNSRIHVSSSDPLISNYQLLVLMCYVCGQVIMLFNRCKWLAVVSW